MVILLKKARAIIEHYIFDNHPLAKFICLIMSIILFFYVYFELPVSSNDRIEYKMPIGIKNTPSHLSIRMDNSTALIEFSGEKNTFSNISNEVYVYVDLENAQEGIKQYPLSIGNASLLPAGVGFTLTPRYVNITFEKLDNTN